MGIVELHANELRAQISKDEVARWLELEKEHSIFPLAFYREDQPGKLLGTPVSVGPHIMLIDEAELAHEDELHGQVASGAEEYWVSIRGHAASPIKLCYKNWLSTEDLESIPAELWRDAT